MVAKAVRAGTAVLLSIIDGENRMANRIKAKQSNKQVDRDLKAISDILESAQYNDGKVLYIRNVQVDLEDGRKLFSIVPIT